MGHVDVSAVTLQDSLDDIQAQTVRMVAAEQGRGKEAVSQVVRDTRSCVSYFDDNDGIVSMEFLPGVDVNLAAIGHRLRRV